MKSDDPYTPVRVPINPIAVRNRPYYIYATAVVMLLWAAIYVYLQSQYTVITDAEGVSVSVPARYARRMYEFNVVSIALWFAFSLVLVNGVLWLVLKTTSR